MNKKTALGLLATFLMISVPIAQAHQPKKVPRVGYLTGAYLSAITACTEAFSQGLRALGYVEGKNIVIEWRSAEGKIDLLPELVAELLRLKVDVIVTAGAAVTRPAKKPTSTIPIVMANDSDPVGNGFVASLARPGGNITGLSTLAPELRGKRLELLKEVVPKLSRVAVFRTSAAAEHAHELKQVELDARGLGVKLQYVDVLSPKDVEAAFRAANKGQADAVLMMVSGPLVNFQQLQGYHSDTFGVHGNRRDAAAEENTADRLVSRQHSNDSRTLRHFDEACVSLDISRVRTLSSSAETPKGNWSVSPMQRLSWSASRWK